jgi:hypothetical protein
MAVRRSDEVESEPVVVHVEQERVRVVLDDGTELAFELEELRQAIGWG